MMLIIQSILCLGLAFLGYHWLLKKEKSFHFNRFYLLGTLLICMWVPLLQIDLPQQVPYVPSIASVEESVAIDESIEEATLESLTSEAIQTTDWLWVVYIAITTILLLRLLVNLLRLVHTNDRRGPQIEGLQIILTKRKLPPCSFFHYLLVHETQFNEEGLSSALIKHERAHSQQWHSLDLLIVELIICFCWFNPFVWLYKKTMVENHEYLADEQVVLQGVAKETYAEKILQSTQAHPTVKLASGFGFVQLKNRLMMLNQVKSFFPVRLAKTISVLLLLTTTLTLSSFDYQGHKKPLVVVVDAGHGGQDHGAVAGPALEKTVALQISQKLATLSKENEVKIILVREGDQFLTLQERADFINKQEADLLLSLHCNLSEMERHHGVEAYHYGAGDFSKESYTYSKILVSEQLRKVCDQGKIKAANFFVLKNVHCPGVLLELGYLSNQQDQLRLQDSMHQLAIAEAIYKGLTAIRASK